MPWIEAPLLECPTLECLWCRQIAWKARRWSGTSPRLRPDHAARNSHPAGLSPLGTRVRALPLCPHSRRGLAGRLPALLGFAHECRDRRLSRRAFAPGPRPHRRPAPCAEIAVSCRELPRPLSFRAAPRVAPKALRRVRERSDSSDLSGPVSQCTPRAPSEPSLSRPTRLEHR